MQLRSPSLPAQQPYQRSTEVHFDSYPLLKSPYAAEPSEVQVDTRWCSGAWLHSPAAPRPLELVQSLAVSNATWHPDQDDDLRSLTAHHLPGRTSLFRRRRVVDKPGKFSCCKLSLPQAKRRGSDQRSACFIAAPIFAGDFATEIPAASRALIFSAAVPLPPAIIAPACPMRLPGGAVCPAINATIGFVICSFV